MTSRQEMESDAERHSGRPPIKSARLALACLLLVNVLSFVDRKLPFILIEQIRIDLDLSDAEIGLLAGVTFSLIYATAGIPLARAADRFSRKWIIIRAVVFWSLCTAVGGAAQSLWQFALARSGLAVGEAAIHPSATSMIADYFPQNKRRTALSIYLLGSFLGGLVGLSLGGLLNQSISWRWVMVLFAIPGLVLGLVLAVVVHEPRRNQSNEMNHTITDNWFKALGQLLSVRAYKHILVGAAVFIFAATSLSAFLPALLMRRFDFSSGEAGVSIGLITGIGGSIGALLGGVVTDRLGDRRQELSLFIPAAALLIAAPLFILACSVQQVWITLAVLPFASVLEGVYLGPVFAVAQNLATARTRALAVAVLNFAMYGIGGALGPFTTGWISDQFKVFVGTQSLQFALSIVCLAFFWSAFHFWRAGRLVRQP